MSGDTAVALERFPDEARAAIRKSAADMKRCDETPAEEWGGHKGIFLANQEGFLGGFTLPLLNALEALEARSAAATMLAEFHERFNYERTSDPGLRRTLHQEEHDELVEAIESGDLAAIARELADVVYVAYGSAWSLGIDLDAAISEVQRANLSKLDDEGQPIRRDDGKVMKGPNFSPPDMSAALPASEATQ